MERQKPSRVNAEGIATAAAVIAFVACAAVDSSAPAALALALETERTTPGLAVNPPAAIPPENIRYTMSCLGLFCTFDARSSVDPSGIVKWTWDWGDGTSVSRTTPTAKKLFANPGIYNVTLTVTNTADVSGSATRPDTILAEPTGMTKLTETGFNCINGCGEWGAWDAQYPGAATLAVDSTAPRSPGGVVQMNYLPLLRGGWAPMSFAPGNNTLPQKQTIYVAMWMKLSSNFQGHPTGVNKVLHFFVPRSGGGNVAIFLVRGTGALPLQAAFGFQGLAIPHPWSQDGRNYVSAQVNLDPPPGVCVVTRGQWHKYEIVLRNNTPGVADGVATLWMDGRICIERPGVGFVGAGQVNKWSQVWWSPTWGGVNGSVVTPFSQIVDHIYVSGK